MSGGGRTPRVSAAARARRAVRVSPETAHREGSASGVGGLVSGSGICGAFFAILAGGERVGRVEVGIGLTGPISGRVAG